MDSDAPVCDPGGIVRRVSCVRCRARAFSIPLAALILAYTLLPAAVAYLARDTPPPTWMDFVIIALLWFPLEFSVGRSIHPQASSELAASCRVRRVHFARPLDLPAVPPAHRDENKPAAIGPRSRHPVARVPGMCSNSDRARSRDRLSPAISLARSGVRHAHCIAVSDYPGRYRAAGRDPVPRADPELHRTEIRDQYRSRFCLPLSFSDARISTMDPSHCLTGAT